MKPIRTVLVLAMLMSLSLALVPTAASAQSASDCTGKQKFFLFEYNTGQVDSGCADKNDVDRSTHPGLIAVKLHVSCSDTFTNGIPRKGDLGDPNLRVVAYFIEGDVSKPGNKTCGIGTPISAGGPAGAILLTSGLALTLGLGLRRRSRKSQTV